MNPNDRLRGMLEDYTTTWNDGQRVPVRFDAQPHADANGRYVAVTADPESFYGVTLDGADELMAIVDSTSHEVEHVRESDLMAKADLVEEYRETGYGDLAGTIFNIVEDHYIDHRRTRRFPGLRRAHATFVQAQMDAADSVADRPTHESLPSAVWQISHAGYAKGMADLDDDTREFLGWIRTKLAETKSTHAQAGRIELSREITDALLDRLPDRPAGTDLAGLFAAIHGPPAAEDSPDDYEPGEASTVATDADTETGDTETGDATPGETGEDGRDGDAGETEGDTTSSPPDLDSDRESAASDRSEYEDEYNESDDPENPYEDMDPEDVPDEHDDFEEFDAYGNNEFEIPDEIQAAIDDMDESDADENAGEWWDETFDPNDRGPVGMFERKYERINDLETESETDLGKLKEERDDRIAKGSQGTTGANAYTGEEIRDHMRETGLADEIRKAFHRLKSGEMPHPDTHGDRLNIRAVVRHAAGDLSERNFYTRSRPGASGGRAVCVSIDGSGSMKRAGRSVKSMVAATALATQEIGDEFMAFEWRNGPRTELITGPAESFAWEHLTGMYFGGSDPLPYGIREGENMLKRVGAKQRLLLVVTDGKPHKTLQGHSSSKTAINQARELTREYRAGGTVVVGIGFGDVDRDTMRDVFGEDGYIMAKAGDLADELVRIYENSLDTDLESGF